MAGGALGYLVEIYLFDIKFNICSLDCCLLCSGVWLGTVSCWAVLRFPFILKYLIFNPSPLFCSVLRTGYMICSAS